MKIDQIEVNIENAIYSTKMKNYGEMIDNLKDFHHTFNKGKSYGIIGQCGEGGWGLSYNLAGKEQFISGDIKIDGESVGLKELQSIGWYVGEGIPERGLFFKKNRVIDQLRKAIKNNPHGSTQSIEEIVKMFNLSNDRLYSKLEELSWEKWRSSIAIGYAMGKRVYCFPWVSTGWINDLILNCGIHICIETLKNSGSIIIIPTQRTESIDFFIDEIVCLHNSRHEPSERAREIVMQYMKNG